MLSCLKSQTPPKLCKVRVNWRQCNSEEILEAPSGTVMVKLSIITPGKDTVAFFHNVNVNPQWSKALFYWFQCFENNFCKVLVWTCFRNLVVGGLAQKMSTLWTTFKWPNPTQPEKLSRVLHALCASGQEAALFVLLSTSHSLWRDATRNCSSGVLFCCFVFLNSSVLSVLSALCQTLSFPSQSCRSPRGWVVVVGVLPAFFVQLADWIGTPGKISKI